MLLACSVALPLLILLQLPDLRPSPGPIAVSMADFTILRDLPVSIQDVSALVSMPVSIDGVSTTDELQVNLHNHWITSGDPIAVEIVP